MRSTLIAVVVVLAVWSVPMWKPAAGRRFALAVEDALARAAGGGAPSGQVVMVGIDEDSVRHVGRWPWPRRRLAELVDSCARAGARMVVLDMLLPEPDAAPAAPAAPATSGAPAAPGAKSTATASTTNANANAATPAPGNAPTASPGDAALAAAMRNVKTVVGYQLTPADPLATPDRPLPTSPAALCHGTATRLGPVQQTAAEVMRLPSAASAICSLPPLAAAAAATGFLNGIPDSDGLTRRAPLVMRVGEELYASLPLAAWLALEPGSPRWEEANAEGAWLARQQARVFLREGMLRLRYRGAGGTLDHLGASEVMAGRHHGRLRGRIVLVGGLAAGLQQHVATPADGFLPGLEFQATVLDNLLRGDSLRPPAAARLGGMLLVLAVVGAVVLLMEMGNGWIAAGGVAAVLAVLWGGCWEAARGAGVLPSPLAPTVGALLALLALAPLRIARDRRQWQGEARLRSEARRFALAAIQIAGERARREEDGQWERFPRYLSALSAAAARDARFQAALPPETRDMLVELAPLRELAALDGLGGAHPDQFQELLTRAWRRGGIKEERMMRLALELCCYHQERWDGGGQPKGLRGDEIPLPARLAAVIDVYDALVRSQGPAAGLSHEAAVQVITAGRGTRFDPALVDCFLRIQDTFRAVARDWAAAQPRRRGAGL